MLRKGLLLNENSATSSKKPSLIPPAVYDPSMFRTQTALDQVSLIQGSLLTWIIECVLLLPLDSKCQRERERPETKSHSMHSVQIVGALYFEQVHLGKRE